MAQSFAEFGDLDIQQSGGQEEAEFGALELQQAQVLFSALNTLRQGQAPLAWDSEAAAEIEVSCANLTSQQYAYTNHTLVMHLHTCTISNRPKLAGHQGKNLPGCHSNRRPHCPQVGQETGPSTQWLRIDHHMHEIWTKAFTVVYRAVLLMTKRDLADLCLEGLLESTEQQQQDQLAELLQACLLLCDSTS